ncbi:uridine phosphorylase [Francisella halioticida]|uniref:uridine phosphorylase n=1 Tax=Francisella halioticida TaxID=549298 RepID=UPI001AFCBEC8|nr:uridine phosphorylase [Francisella halioticida]BCD92555.1 uridine phosphorylase [Francisella halioticida]
MSNNNIENRQAAVNEVLYHIKLSQQMIEGADIAILPGDPGRVKYLADMLDAQNKFLACNREYASHLCTVGDKKVLVVSTGMGGPSVAIGVEELAMIGIKKFIRVGTCGTIQEHINIGDLILTTASVRLDGASMHYAPIEYPAVASFKLNSGLFEAANSLNVKVHVGVTGSSDTFFPGQERFDSYSGYVRNYFKNSVSEWRKLNVLNLEMESSALLTVCSVFGLDASCICMVIAKRTASEKVDTSGYAEGMMQIIKIIKSCIESVL